MLNKVVIVGRLVREPEMGSVGRFTVAYNRRYKKGDEWVEESHFFDVKVFGKLVERLGKYKKGDLVFVEGRLSQDRWETETGEKRSRISIVADRVLLIKAKEDSLTVEDEGEGVDVPL